jgi:DNA-directed RNA polymerase subunit H (RpoH/RPB5)
MELKDRFFGLFVKELLMNSLDPFEKQRIEEKRKKLQQLKKEMETLMDEKINIQLPKIPQNQPVQQSLITNQNNLPLKQPSQISQETQENLTPNLQKVERMIQDPTVAVIECPGPGKFIIIKRGFKRFPTRVILNKDEIEEILNYYSEESRIPRIGGVFKAIVDNQVLTAIDSSYGGPRFIITKTRTNV